MRLSTRSRHKWLIASFFLGFVLTTALAAGLFSPKTAHAASTFTNPISPTADPFITYYHGIYYLTGTHTGTTIEIQHSPLLESVGDTSTTIWSPGSGEPQYQVWSPSMFLLNYHGTQHWFVYFTAASTNDNASHRIYVLMSSGSDPLGPYTFQGQLAGSDNTTTIDPSIIQINNQLYILDVEEPGVQHVGEPGANVTYIAPLSDPLTQSGPSQSLIYPDQSWERGGGSGQSTYPVAEGPEALYHNGKTFIVYSGSDTGDYTYCLGLLTYNGGNPLDFHSWSKSGPVFQYSAANGVYGPGRASFTTSPDGTESWMVYHAKTSSSYTYSGRTTRAQQFYWNQDGTPNFGSPVGLNVPLQVPSGESGAGATGPIHAPAGKCVDVAGGNATSGTPVQLWDCNGTNAQAWTVASDGTLQALGKCLDIIGNGTAPGIKVQLWDCNGVGGQQWVPQANGSLLNPQSGDCLDDPGGNTANGTQLQIWTCNNLWPQVYQLPGHPLLGAIGAPGGKCVDVAGGNPASGTPVQLWGCNGTNAQVWTVASDGTLRALGKCLDIIGNGTALGTKVQLWDCNGVGGQQWVPQANGSLLNPQSGDCLDDPGGNTVDGTQLQIWTCNNQWPQVYQVP